MCSQALRFIKERSNRNFSYVRRSLHLVNTRNDYAVITYLWSPRYRFAGDWNCVPHKTGFNPEHTSSLHKGQRWLRLSQASMHSWWYSCRQGNTLFACPVSKGRRQMTQVGFSRASTVCSVDSVYSTIGILLIVSGDIPVLGDSGAIGSWSERMVTTTLDIGCSWWMLWNTCIKHVVLIMPMSVKSAIRSRYISTNAKSTKMGITTENISQ